MPIANHLLDHYLVAILCDFCQCNWGRARFSNGNLKRKKSSKKNTTVGKLVHGGVLVGGSVHEELMVLSCKLPHTMVSGQVQCSQVLLTQLFLGNICRRPGFDEISPF